MRQRSIDMTHGPMALKILAFALPIAFSSMLQQLFNSADVIVVGRFVGPQALAAVGSNGAIINLQINLFVGLSTGASVVLARYLGGGNTEKISKTVHTVIRVALVSGLLLALVGNLCSRPLLEVMDTPEDVIDLATLYLRIYFLGMPLIMLYNFGSAILRSKGDTTRPMVSLLLAGILNVILNLLFVLAFGWGVAGVAIATVLSNALSTTLILKFLLSEDEPLRLHPSKIAFDPQIFKAIAWVGIPSGLQSTVFSLSNILIQSAINGFGSKASAGNATAGNYDAFVYFICLAFTNAAATFVSQNYGFGDAKRCKRAWLISSSFGMLFSGMLSLVFTLFRQPLASFFTSDPEVIAFACQRMQWVQPFQWTTSLYDATAAAIRSLGSPVIPSVLTVLGIVVFRVIWLATVFKTIPSYLSLMLVYPASWLLTNGLMLGAYAFASRKARKVLERESRQ